MQKLSEEVELIREVFTYAAQFTNKTFVIKIDYPLTRLALFPLFLKDISLLHQSGIRIVLVPGARERIDEVLANYGFQSQFASGYRIAGEEEMPFVKMACFDVVNHYMTVLSAFKVPAVAGNWVRARAVGVLDGVDHGYAGRADKILVDLLRSVLDDHYIPILPNIGWSLSGKPYLLKANELALEVSKALKADKLFFINNFECVTSPPFQVPASVGIGIDGRVARLSINQAAEFIKVNSKHIEQADHPIIQGLLHAHQACQNGVERAHLIDGRIDGSLLMEIFSNLGVGTMIYNNEYDCIRDLRIEDIPVVLQIMAPFVEQDILIPRSFEDIESRYTDYVVYSVDEVVYACGALHEFPEDGQAEIAALATDPAMNFLGMGKSIVNYLIDRARSRGYRRVFVLTTQTLDWFESLGFKEVKLESLPPARRATYNHKRKSRIFALELV